MKKRYSIIPALFLIFACSVNNVFAYIDIGSGVSLFGSIWPFIVALFSAIGLFLIKHFWKPIKQRISKLRKKGQSDDIRN